MILILYSSFLFLNIPNPVFSLARSEMEPAVKHRVQFYIEDALTMDYPDNFYDVVYSRDTILHIADKKQLFGKFLKTLKPGGQLMIR